MASILLGLMCFFYIKKSCGVLFSSFVLFRLEMKMATEIINMACVYMHADVSV
jgi:hypothetical protein